MIVSRVNAVGAAGAQAVTMWLRPNRALSYTALQRLAWGLAAATLAAALIDAYRGNVFAPLFALAEGAALVAGLTVAWRAGGKGERITLERASLVVEAWPGHTCTRFQAAWVRVSLVREGTRQRLLLQSHGRQLEIGAFLGEEERARLKDKLERSLAQLTAPIHKQTDNGSGTDPEGLDR